MVLLQFILRAIRLKATSPAAKATTTTQPPAKTFDFEETSQRRFGANGFLLTSLRMVFCASRVACPMTQKFSA